MKAKTLNILNPKDLNYFVDQSYYHNKIEEKQLKEHIRYYKKLVKYMPFRVDANGMLGFCSYQSGEIEKAIQYYHKAIEGEPDFFAFYYNLAAIYFNNGEYERAVSLLNKAVRIEPKHALRVVLKSKRIYMSMVSHIAGIRGLNFDQLYKEELSLCFELLARAYYLQKKYQDMYLVARGAIGSGAENESMHYYYAGVASMHLNEIQRACLLLEESVKSDGNNVDAFKALGACLKKVGADKTAQKVFLQAEHLRRNGFKEGQGPAALFVY